MLTKASSEVDLGNATASLTKFPKLLVEDGASLATVGRASCPRRLEACTTSGRQIYASGY